MSKPNEQYEPSASARTLAKVQYDHFQAMIQEGFTEQQALTIIGQMLLVATFGPEEES